MHAELRYLMMIFRPNIFSPNILNLGPVLGSQFVFPLNCPLGWFSLHVKMSVCLCFCLCHHLHAKHCQVEVHKKVFLAVFKPRENCWHIFFFRIVWLILELIFWNLNLPKLYIVPSWSSNMTAPFLLINDHLKNLTYNVCVFRLVSPTNCYVEYTNFYVLKEISYFSMTVIKVTKKVKLPM